MDTDLVLAIGVVVGAMSIPTMLSAYADSRSPRMSALAFLLALGCIVWAVRKHPGGYALADVPSVLIEVIGRIF